MLIYYLICFDNGAAGYLLTIPCIINLYLDFDDWIRLDFVRLKTRHPLYKVREFKTVTLYAMGRVGLISLE